MVNKLLIIPSENLYELLFIFESLIRLAYPSTPELIEKKFHDLSDPIIKDVYVRACGVSNYSFFYFTFFSYFFSNSFF
jgi:hypothetical protein